MTGPMRRAALFLMFSALGCSGTEPGPEGSDPPVVAEVTDAQAEIVSAWTSGTVSRNKHPRVRFVDDVVGPDAVGRALPRSPFVFDPHLDGTASWTGVRELSFEPVGSLEPGRAYTASVDLGALDPAWAGETATFAFSAVVQSFRMTAKGLEAEGADGGLQEFHGSIQTADDAEPGQIEAMFTATHGGDPLPVTWTHEEGHHLSHFVVRGIQRADGATTLELVIDGAPLGLEGSQRQSVEVPGLSDFALASVRPVTAGERYLELRFSDPLASGQDLAGLIRLDGRTDLRFDVDGSTVRVYGRSPLRGETTVRVEGVRSSKGHGLSANVVQEVSFAPAKPEVRFASKGVIFPTTDGLTVPIEVMNLRSIEIEAIRVHDRNVPQFLQVNDLEGHDEMKRVGRVVWRQRVPVDATPDRQNRWTRLGLDVSPLIAANPNGLYRLAIRFNHDDVIYTCAEPWTGGETPPLPSDDGEEGAAAESSYWDNWSNGQGVDPWDAWENRHDPCHPGYYQSYDDHDITASRNVLVSDVGLIAKRGEDGAILAIATDLSTAAPLEGATLRLLDYQLTEVASGSTDAAGMVDLDPSRRPFMLVAEHAGQSGYLRLDGGGSLSVGHFDVSGTTVRGGLKGFFYGERGVWRPGDDIHLSFLMLDTTGALPDDHPVHFELRSPRGQIVERRTLTEGMDGFYDLGTSTAADAPTGNYIAKVQVGGASFEQVLRVETVMANRLEIDLDFGTELIKAPALALDSTLSSRWLHGAIAGGLKADISLRLRPTTTSFPAFDGFSFDDPTAAFDGDELELFSGVLDDQGSVAVDVPIEIGSRAPGMLTATFKTRVFEPSGAFSIDQASVGLSPHERYIGIKTPKGDAARGMLLTDTSHRVEIVALDGDGKPAGDGEVELKLYEISWRWWWEQGEDDLADFAGSEEHTALRTEKVTLKGGKATWDFQVDYPEWGRYLITATDLHGTHQTGKIAYIDWPGWAGRAQKDNPGGASVLSVTTEQQQVEVGQQVTVSFPSAPGGRALVSLETGTEVLRTAWVEPALTGSTTSWTFEATPRMAPSVYAHVTMLQPHGADANDLPIRMYGLVPIEVVDPATRLDPEISTAEVFEPETTARVEVSEAAGQPMTYTVAVVDEGLLGLTRFKTPDPWAWFYRREALGVRTWDLFDMVAGAYGAALEGMIAIGGGGEGEDGPQAKANRFPPVVQHLGPFRLEANETKTHEVPIPAYVGKVRVMVVAAHDGAYGSDAVSVPVRTPLMVLATLPRVMGPAETLDLPVSVFAMDDTVKDVELSVVVEGPVALVGDASQQLRFGRPGDQMASFTLRVAEELGIARVTVRATSGSETAVQTLELDVRHPGTRQVEVFAAAIEPGGSWNQDLTLTGIDGTNEALVELSRVPPLNLGSRLDGLIRYPHGCAEQTTSGAFPQVYLTSLMELPDARAAEVDRNVKAGLTRLKSFQTAAGGFGYWPGDAQAHDWASSYVGHFLLEAERAGYVLPAGMRSGWVGWQRDQAGRWVRGDGGSDLEQAYRLYTLALAGEAELGAMNRLKELSLSPAGRWRLAAAYQLAGQPETARALTKGVSTEVKPYQELSGTFGSELRDQAMILETLVAMGDGRAGELAKQVSEALSADRWQSTQATAYGLVALARFAQEGGTSDAVSASWSLARSAAAAVSSDKPMVQIQLPVKDGSRPPLVIDNTGAGTLFVRAIVAGLPRVGEDKALSGALKLTTTYVDAEGTTLDAAAMDHGQDFIAKVTVANTTGRALPELALSHLVPSGWEIHGMSSGSGSGYDYRDVRDDRVYSYFDLAPNASTTFEVKLNAAYLGRYYLPPISVEAMYDTNIQARSAGLWTEVVPPGLRG